MNKINQFPRFTEMFKPFLETHNDGKEHSIFDIEDQLAKQFNVSDQDRQIIKSSGGEKLFLNKIRWVKTHMTMAKLVKQTKTNHCIITIRGKEVLQINPNVITEKFLSRYVEYQKSRGKAIIFERRWSMPNKWTYDIQPISELLDQEIEGFTVDAFSGKSQLADLRNDLNPKSPAQFHLEAIEFLKTLKTNSVDTVLFDPPYSPRQITESYKSIGLKASKQDTQSCFYSKAKDEYARVCKLGGKAICFGWNSNGMGINRGFSIEKILLVPHGSAHNDTIVTVERKFENKEIEN